MNEKDGGPAGPRTRPGRYPAIVRVCLLLNWLFVACWGAYVVGPDSLGVYRLDRSGVPYALFTGVFFLIHFVLIVTGIIALFVVIIEMYADRPVVGFRSVIAALALPITSFLYFAARYLAEVRRWLGG
jgi:hypothetical protein